MVYKFSCAACYTRYVSETNQHLVTCVREHLTSDKNSRFVQHINGSDTCKAFCSEDCFSILDTASTSFQLRIKEALHIGWEKPLLKKQISHVNLSLSFFHNHVVIQQLLFNTHCIYTSPKSGPFAFKTEDGCRSSETCFSNFKPCVVI